MNTNPTLDTVFTPHQLAKYLLEELPANTTASYTSILLWTQNIYGSKEKMSLKEFLLTVFYKSTRRVDL